VARTGASIHEQTAAVKVQTSVGVDHEDLLTGEDVRHLHQAGRSSSFTRPETVTNVHAGCI
jgi:hypothetical protein